MGPSFTAFADELSKIAAAGLTGLPGVAAHGPAAQDQLQLGDQLKTVAHGLEGRLTRPAVAGAKNKDMQGPRAYAPRLSKT